MCRVQRRMLLIFGLEMYLLMVCALILHTVSTQHLPFSPLKNGTKDLFTVVVLQSSDAHFSQIFHNFPSKKVIWYPFSREKGFLRRNKPY